MNYLHYGAAAEDAILGLTGRVKSSSMQSMKFALALTQPRSKEPSAVTSIHVPASLRELGQNLELLANASSGGLYSTLGPDRRLRTELITVQDGSSGDRSQT